MPAQYQRASRLRALCVGLADLVWAELCAPVAAYGRWGHVERLSGPALTALGVAVGVERPLVRSTGGKYLGLQGTESAGGKPIGQAPFFTLHSASVNRHALDDAAYRLLIHLRVSAVWGGAVWGAYERGFGRLFGGTVTLSGGTVTFTAPAGLSSAESSAWALIVSSAELAERVLPVPAGMAGVYSVETTDP